MSEYVLTLEPLDSTLIKEIIYYDDTQLLYIYFKNKYPAELEVYEEVPMGTFEAFSMAKSFGKFYLNNIKPIFNKQKLPIMSDDKKKPVGINKASNKKRFIKMSIDTSQIDKKYFSFGDNGKVYFNLTLMMLPDGEVDKYQNLGMIVQDVPKEVYDKAPKDEKPKGNILGNGKELWWPEQGEVQTKTFEELSPDAQKKAMEDLPF